ncbi:MAG: acyl-CoA dehydrogenase C-terminal domain-containing protein [Betaproteobacteria bacterium]
MPDFRVPVRDMRFLLNEVFDYPAHYRSMVGGDDASPEVVDAILEATARYCENVLAPLNASGDREGCRLEQGEVRTPSGFREAYQQFIEGGWQSLSFPVEYGGQGWPMSMNLLKTEMMGAANWAFAMYPGLSVGCIATLLQFGSEPIRQRYLPSLISGRWTGTMCLTEPQCGSDLGQIKTRAQPLGEDRYAIRGTKIFISSGEHDLTENIIHIVLARLPDAPKGTRGISLFLVPKVKVGEDGRLGERNAVVCGAIEPKMGIAASATALLNFDEAEGFLIGEPHKGLEAMFTFMNTARLGTAIQGVAHAEQSFQGALAYAQTRRSMRALSGTREPDQPADALIWHPDVRRMLLTQKAIAEGGRAMVYAAAKIADRMFDAIRQGDTKTHQQLDEELGFYTPILKGFLTELGLEAAQLGVQVYGGHGYIREHGMEQIVRDARVATLYEGTTGIQALDLLGRKVLLATRGACVRQFTRQMIADAKPYLLRPGAAGRQSRTLVKRALQWNLLTVRLMMRAARNRDEVGAASVDYLMFSGYLMMAHFWALQARAAERLLESGSGDQPTAFYQAKLDCAEFYFERLLPRADAHARCALAPIDSLMRMDRAAFRVE